MNSSKPSLDSASKPNRNLVQLLEVARTSPERTDALASSLPAKQNRLNSWKEIAAYLQREIRTVQRWEKSEGLPVHRHYHQKIGTVFAFKEEIDTWSHSRAALPLRPRKSSPQDRGDALAISSQAISTAESAIGLHNPLGELPLFSNIKRGFIPAVIYIDPKVFSRELSSIRRGERGAAGVSLASQNVFRPDGVSPPRSSPRPRRRAVAG